MLVTFYVIAYNHETMIADAIKAALSQTYSPLQIIISDDCSTDRTWDVIIRETANYKGPHSLVVRRNSVNLGVSAHINAIWAECQGDWIVASAGDDISIPERTERTLAVVKQNNNIKLVQCWLNEVDVHGNFIGINKLHVENTEVDCVFFSIHDRIKGKYYFQHGAGMAYSRDLIDVFGPLPRGVIFEDNIINIRAELLGLAAVLTVPLINHRNHSGQITQTAKSISAVIREQRRKIRLLSAIDTRRQNLIDVEKVVKLPKSLKIELIHMFQREWEREKLIYDAIIGGWPSRLMALIRVMRKFPDQTFRKDDLIRALFPYWVYAGIKAVRNKPFL